MLRVREANKEERFFIIFKKLFPHENTYSRGFYITFSFHEIDVISSIFFGYNQINFDFHVARDVAPRSKSAVLHGQNLRGQIDQAVREHTPCPFNTIVYILKTPLKHN